MTSLRATSLVLAALLAACARSFAQETTLEEDDDAYERALERPEGTIYAPRVLPDVRRAPVRRLDEWPQIYRDDRLTVTGTLTATLGLYRMGGNQFAADGSPLPPGIVRNPAWAEWLVDPGITATYDLGGGVRLHGGLSYLESATRGRDYAGNDDIYHGMAELAYGGVTLPAWRDWTVDLSYGQQELMVGDGMLLWSGATNGTQRGAAFISPRKAWANAAIVKASSHETVVEAFYLKPNEAQAEDTGTRIAGINAKWEPPGSLRLGATYAHVTRSQIVTRSGLDVLDVRAHWHPSASLPEFWLQGEIAWQYGRDVRAVGGYVQASYNGKTWPWQPLVSLQWSSLSGDKPGSSRWEGFDPLYFGNGNPNWYPGTIASTLFVNTNLQVASLTVTLNPTDKQILEFWLLDFRAAVANAPLDIPSPNAPAPTGGGVPSRSLAREVDASWTYTFDKHVNVNVIAGYATPGSGVRAAYEEIGGTATGWWFVGTQLNVSY